MDEISEDALYEGLLAYGLFADKLPPVFNAISFFHYCENLSDSFSKGWNKYITFRVIRNNGVPRIMGIPNPFKYQRLCFALKSNWDLIKEHFHRQTDNQDYRISRIHIRKAPNKKCIFKMRYNNWHNDENPELDLLIQDNGISHILIKADLSTCFPSIYTHSIPWAFVGKELAKQNYSDKDAWYNKIDSNCSDMHNGETHGILIGPHTSNLISEVILTVIDKTLYDKGYRYIRNIDDYECYVRSYDEAQRFLADLESTLDEFDLRLNHKKTKIINLPMEMDKDWKHELRALPSVNTNDTVKFAQANKFIDIALKLAMENDDIAIINYAIKKMKSLTLDKEAKKLAAKRFMHMAAIYPYLLCLMEEYVFFPYQVDKNTIKKFSDAIYREAMKINDYASLCYTIYFAIKFDFVLDEFDSDWRRGQDYIFNSKDCLLLVMAWLYFMKANRGKRDATQIKPFNKLARELKKNDMDQYWLFCYEVLSYGNLAGDWKKMKEKHVSFIDSWITTEWYKKSSN